MVKICHLYQNVQNKLHNKKKVDGVRKLVSEHSSQAKFKMAAMKSLVMISSSIIEIETILFTKPYVFGIK